MDRQNSKNPSEPIFLKSAHQADFILDDEFQSFLPSLKPSQYESLQNSILNTGVIYSALIVWVEKNILIDGYHRYKIALEHNLPITLIYMEFEDRNDVKAWMVENALGLRSIHGKTLSFCRGQQCQFEVAQALEDKDDDDELEAKRTQKNTARKIADKFEVGVDTIKKDVKYSEAIEAIDTNVSATASKQIKDGQIKFNKDQVIKIGKAIVAAPEIVKQAFLETREAKKILKHINTVISQAPEDKKFPYPVGSIVKINARKNPDLKITNGLMAVVTEVSPDSDSALVQTYCGQFRVRTRNVVFYRLNEPERGSAESIIYRLARLAVSEPTSATVSLIQDISRRVVNCFSPQEEKWISDAEKLANLEKFENMGQSELNDYRKAKLIDDNHRSWIVNLFWQNVENLKDIDLSSIANAIAKLRPDDVASLVLELANHENLASEIIGKLQIVYSSLFEEAKAYSAA